MSERRTFEVALQNLGAKLHQMGVDTQTALQLAVGALRNLDFATAKQVVDGDRRINAQEHEIEDLCIRLIVTQQPVATDLRKIVAGLRISSDLERMADLAVDIAKTVTRLQNKSLALSLIDIQRMADIVDDMLSIAIDAYVTNNQQAALALAELDDSVDHTYRLLLEGLFNGNRTHSNIADQALSICLVGRYLERIGDHATNIGEHLIYISTGERFDLN